MTRHTLKRRGPRRVPQGRERHGPWGPGESGAGAPVTRRCCLSPSSTAGSAFPGPVPARRPRCARRPGGPSSVPTARLLPVPAGDAGTPEARTTTTPPTLPEQLLRVERRLPQSRSVTPTRLSGRAITPGYCERGRSASHGVTAAAPIASCVPIILMQAQFPSYICRLD